MNRRMQERIKFLNTWKAFWDCIVFGWGESTSIS